MLVPTAVAATEQQAHAEAVPAGSVSVHGLWTVHKAGTRVLFELPASALQRELVVQRARSGVVGPSHQIVRWERLGDRIMLYSPEIRQLNDLSGGLLPGQTRGDTRLVESFPIIGQGRSGAPIIDVTALFTRNLADWLSDEGQPSASKKDIVIDPALTTIASVKSFPKNVVVTAVQAVSEKGQSTTIRTRWNFVLLPKRPMMPRLWDRRFGQMELSFGMGALEPRQGEQTLMLRWRLEKKDPTQAVSEPVKPIVFYIDPATPAKWRDDVRRGIEAWQPAFKAAGFKNAIVARDAPADWSPDDVRFSTLLWNLESNGRSEHIHRVIDPRTGEFLHNNFVSAPWAVPLLARRYFVANAAVDPRARAFPIPDDIIGDLQARVVSHEVGHMLGLRDGNYGKSAYSIDNVRSPAWLARMGFTPSIMNYTRTNYVAQPEDKVPPELLVQRVGPADHYQIRAAYEPVPDAKSATDERSAIDALARLQEKEPMYRFNHVYEYVNMGVGANSGPDTVLEVVETIDPVRTTELGLRNLRAALAYMPTATIHGRGDQAIYEDLYEAARLHWMDMMHHVASLVGGYTRFLRAGHEPRPEAMAIPAAELRRAMQFLAKEAFQPPLYLIGNGVTRLLPTAARINGDSEITRVMDGPINILGSLLYPNRLRRLAEAEHGVGMFAGAPDRYALTTMLADLRGAIWSELKAQRIQIDPYRQSLQEAHIDLLKKRLTAPPEPSLENGAVLNRPLETYIKNVLLADLEALRAELGTAATKASDPVVKAHIRRMQAQAAVM